MSVDETLARMTKEAIEKLELVMGELFKLPQSDRDEKDHKNSIVKYMS